jgi:hypothetical protein
MLFKKKEEDIEMAGFGDQQKPKKKNEGPQDTEYQSLDLKKIFLSPKYIRTSLVSMVAGAIGEHTVKLTSPQQRGTSWGYAS